MEIKNKPQHRKESYLKYQFLELEIPAIAIAKNNSVCVKTVRTWLKKYNIKKEEPLYHDEVWLREQYLILKKSIREIAKMCVANTSTIKEWLVKFGIVIRPKKEATGLYWKQKNKLNNINGRMLYRNYKNNRILREHNGYLYGF